VKGPTRRAPTHIVRGYKNVREVLFHCPRARPQKEGVGAASSRDEVVSRRVAGAPQHPKTVPRLS
jgi:hypothetical protein